MHLRKTRYMVNGGDPLFVFLKNSTYAIKWNRKFVLSVLCFTVLFTSIYTYGNGAAFLFAHADPPVNITKAPKEIPLAKTAYLNIITKVKNLYSYGGMSISSNGTRTAAPVISPAEGSLTAKDFTYRVVNGIGDELAGPFRGKPAESGRGQIVYISPGSYRVVFESPDPSAYVTDMSADCIGEVKTKEVKECIITHTYVGTATLKIITEVDNTAGGTSKPEDFTVFVELGNPHDVTGKSAPGQKVTLFPVTDSTDSPAIYYYLYHVRPANYYGHPYDFPGYIVKASGWCEFYKDYKIPDILIKRGISPECTLTYKFVGKATLKVTTTVDNTGGGTYMPGSFENDILNNGVYLSEDKGDSIGKVYEISAGSYSATGESGEGYLHTESSDCFGTISAGETKDCTIAYTFKGP